MTPGRLPAFGIGLGLLAHGAQVTLVREAWAVGLPGESGAAVLLGVWLLAGAAGAAAAPRRGAPGLAFAALVATMAGVVAARFLLSGSEGPLRVAAAPGARLAVLALLVGLPALLANAALAAVLAAADPAGRPRLYAAECAGAVAAGCLATLVPGAVPSLLPWSLREAAWSRALPGARLLLESELASGRLSLLELRGQLAVYRDGRIAAWLPGDEGDAALVLPALARVGAGARVLVLDPTPGGLVPALLREPVGQVVWACRDPDLVTAIAARWSPLGTVLRDPRLQLASEDPRRLLSGLAPGSFDLAILPPGPSAWVAESRLHTVEAFAELRRVLSPSGVLTFAMPGFPAGTRHPAAGACRAVLDSLASGLGGKAVLAGSAPIRVLAGVPESEATAPPETLAARLPGSSLGESLVHHLALWLDPDEAASARRSLERAEPGLHRDLSPLAVGRMREAGLAGLAAAGSLVPAVSILLLAWLALVARTASDLGGGPLARAAAAGAFSMLGWAGGVLVHQTTWGALYRDLGLLGALSLLGLAFGARLDRGPAGPAVTTVCLLGLAGCPGIPAVVRSLSALAAVTTSGIATGSAMARLLTHPDRAPGALQAAELAGAVVGLSLAAWLVFGAGGLALALVLLAVAGAILAR